MTPIRACPACGAQTSDEDQQGQPRLKPFCYAHGDVDTWLIKLRGRVVGIGDIDGPGVVWMDTDPAAAEAALISLIVRQTREIDVLRAERIGIGHRRLLDTEMERYGSGRILRMLMQLKGVRSGQS